jgi:Flp pilus assembly protein TadB
MKLTELLNSSQQVDALEIAVRSLPGGDIAIDDAVDAVLAEAEKPLTQEAPDE